MLSEHLILLVRILINMSVVNRCWNEVSCLNVKERDCCCSKQLPLNQLHGWPWYGSNQSFSLLCPLAPYDRCSVGKKMTPPLCVSTALGWQWRNLFIITSSQICLSRYVFCLEIWGSKQPWTRASLMCLWGRWATMSQFYSKFCILSILDVE